MSLALRFLDAELEGLRERALLREPREFPHGSSLLCSNDYLGLAHLGLDHPGLAHPGLAQIGVSEDAQADIPPPLTPGGAGASPLVVGHRIEHRDAEAALAGWLGVESALLFSSGYAANVGTISALVGPGDVVVSDALNHASIIDGCRLSGARIIVVPHRDSDAVASALLQHRGSRRRLVVTEAYFSMDADVPHLRHLRSICAEHDGILMVDEAHSLGVYGPGGRGLCAAEDVRPDVLVGTLGKSLGLHGAFVAGSKSLRLYLWNKARSLVFSTAISPGVAKAVPARVGMVVSADAGREVLRTGSEWLRSSLDALGWTVPGDGPIIPIVVGDVHQAVSLSMRLHEAGLVVQAIRPPTVPVGAARLRVTMTLGSGREAYVRLLDSLGQADAQAQVPPSRAVPSGAVPSGAVGSADVSRETKRSLVSRETPRP